VLTVAGCAALAEVGVLAAVRNAPTDLGRDARAWATLTRELAARTDAIESALLAAAAATADAGDLTSAARTLALRARPLTDFATRDALAALLPSVEPAPAKVPVQRTPEEPAPALSTMDVDWPMVTLRFGRGVPDSVLLNPTSDDEVFAPMRRGSVLRRLLAIVGAGLLVAGGAAAWWVLQR
jgi:hypothetical protein